MDRLDIKRAALVLIDLQHGILARPLSPHSAADVLDASRKLADRFRALGGVVVLVTVDWRPGFADALRQPVDQPMEQPQGGPAPDFAELSPAIGAVASDLRIIKRQWGGFYGTELDLQLRRRGVGTLVIGGVATNMGVESTARDGWERGYAIVFAEDAITTFSAEMHSFAVKTIFPRIGRVSSSDAVVAALSAS